MAHRGVCFQKPLLCLPGLCWWTLAPGPAQPGEAGGGAGAQTILEEPSDKMCKTETCLIMVNWWIQRSVGSHVPVCVCVCVWCHQNILTQAWSLYSQAVTLGILEVFKLKPIFKSRLWYSKGTVSSRCCVLSHSVVSDSLRPRGLYPARLLCPWNFSGKNAGVGCIPSAGGSSRPRNWTLIPYGSCVGRRVLYH